MDPLSRVPTMNIQQVSTYKSEPGPVKGAFRSAFAVLPPSARGHVVGFIGEFIGTISMLFFAFAGGQSGAAASNSWENGGQGEEVSTKPPGFTPQLLLFIAFSAGISLVVHAWIFFRISGGLFNPVVSLGMALIGAITWARCGLLMLAQTLGAIAASYIVNALYAGQLHTDTHLNPGISAGQGVVIEMLLTALVCFTIFMLAAEKHESTHLAPIGIGFSLLVAQLAGFFWTGASLNPARSLAPCMVNHSFTEYHWIYWVGPITGSLLAVLLFKLVKALEYERLHEPEEEQRLISHVDRGQNETAPLTAVGPRPTLKREQHLLHTVQVRDLSHKSFAENDVRTEEAKERQRKNQRRDSDELPECFAD